MKSTNFLQDTTMNLNLPIDIAENYLSGSQRIRVMTEHWVTLMPKKRRKEQNLKRLGS
jgi:hypothetical protein